MPRAILSLLLALTRARAEPPPEHLRADYEAGWTQRATLSAAPRWRLVEADPWQVADRTPHHPEEMVVVEARADALRVVGEWSGLRVALWIDPASLEQRVRAPVVIHPG